MGQQRMQKTSQKIPWDNTNANRTFQNLWDTGKANLRAKLTAIQAYPKKQTNLTLHLMELEK